MIPTTRQKWTHPDLTPARGRYSIYPGEMEGWVDLWLVTYRDGLSVHRRSPIQVLTQQCTAGSGILGDCDIGIRHSSIAQIHSDFFPIRGAMTTKGECRECRRPRAVSWSTQTLIVQFDKLQLLVESVGRKSSLQNEFRSISVPCSGRELSQVSKFNSAYANCQDLALAKTLAKFG